MANFFDKVMDLIPAKTTWKIKVKIIRLWRQYWQYWDGINWFKCKLFWYDYPVSEIHYYYANFIEIYWYLYGFNDTHDRGIRFMQLLMRMWFRSLNLSSKKVIRDIHQFFAFLSMSLLSINKHPYKIWCQATTRIRLCDDLPYRLTGFTHVNFREILDETLSPEYLIGESKWNRCSDH